MILGMGDGVMPFSTQFFHDDYDDGGGGDGFDDGFGFPEAESSMTPAPEGEDTDLLAATQNLGRKVRPEAVNFAKRAKRVDVRKLKENIWRELDIVTSHKKEEDLNSVGSAINNFTMTDNKVVGRQGDRRPAPDRPCGGPQLH
jgi:hypothetical protein